ncbi:MAG: acyl-[acyl-carrier-protein]--UDP-N-acetylglucosamine O-acyltransferase [Bacteroidia bacterium]|nr:MAG: acyl-[acyl-carrier-protein]--UDP-N-acetylglucosamine O-acyltransferase [Bacteroidia bacterium]
MSTQIDPRAVVSPKAALGEGVRIGPFAVIEEDVVIGAGTSVGPHAMIYAGTRIGKDCRIFNSASVGGPPQDLKFKGETTYLEIGDRTVIREFATLNRATGESGVTRVGSDCLLMAYTHVAHDCQLGNHVILANCAALGGHVIMGDYAIIGGLTPVHQFVHIGEHSMIGGGFRVPKDVPPFVLAGDDPLGFERLNLLGLRRRGFSSKVIELLDLAYRTLYKSNLNVSQAVQKIRDEVELVPEVQRVLDFIAESKRGIIPAAGRRD